MKKFLALILALTMVASGSVLALAEETAGDATGDTTTGTTEGTTEPTTPGEGTDDTTTSGDGTNSGDTTPPADNIDRNAPITVGGCYPGETINRTWSILAPNNSQGIEIITTSKITEWDHENVTDFNSTVRDSSGVLEYVIRLNNPLTSVEDVGKTISDTISITLEDGNTYSFNLVVTYRGGAKVQCKNQLKVFTVGQQVTLDVEIIDPTDVYVLPQEIEFEQDVVTGHESDLAEGNLLDYEIKSNDGEKNFAIVVTPLRKGVEHVYIHTTDATGLGYGQGWQIEVIKEGEEPAGSTSIPSRTEAISENEAAQNTAVDAIEAANEAIAKGEAVPSKVQTVTTASGASASVVSAKLYGLNATLSLSTMETLAGSTVGLRANLDNGAAEVVIPGGFQMPTGTGVLAYSLGYQNEPLYTNLMRDAVGDEKAQVCRLGGGVLPTDATITLKTKLTGQVNVYYWNEDTRRLTLIASSTAQGGKVTFASRQLGNLIITPNKI